MEKKGAICIISGPSGSGKNTVYDGLCLKSDNIAQTISVTTRPPREGETDGKDYYFVSTEDFLRKVEQNEFVEYVKYGNNYYGTLKSEIERLRDEGKTVILVIEVEGALNIKKAFPDAKSIFLVPPSPEELRRRISRRGQNSDEDIEIRLRIAEKEMSYKDKYDYCIVNDELQKCIDEVYDIINK